MMDLKAFGQELEKIGLPLLGAALPLPGGAALGQALAGMIGPSPVPSGPNQLKDLLQLLQTNATSLAQAQQFQLTHQETLLRITVDAEMAQRKADSADLAAINQTMQVEATNSDKESWINRNWRGFNGMVVGGGAFSAVVGVMYLLYQGILHNNPTAINSISAVGISVTGILMVPGAAVGITAWHQGKQDREATSQST